MADVADSDGDSISCIFNYVICTIIAGGYVGSLYVWKNHKNEASTHPTMMKKRFTSVITATIISPFVVLQFIDRRLLLNHSLWQVLGFRTKGLLAASTLPLFLTWILFLGPIVVQYCTGIWWIYVEPRYWLAHMKQLVNVRNYIVAPTTEEIVFRACIISLIIHCTDPIKVIFICPLFFGAAHLHHMKEQIRLGVPWKNALFGSCFQFLYTSLFGAYSAYLFIRTGHIIAPILVHAFCNHMGFPDFASVLHLAQPKKSLVVAAFVLGLTLWAVLLQAFTEPSLYANDLPWVV